jgi:predicted small lipoprotein YifL
MTKISRSFLAAMVLSTLFIALAGCQKEGPAERAGKAMDNAAEKTGDKIEQAGDKIKDAAHDLKK